jgi:hypothetical protein
MTSVPVQQQLNVITDSDADYVDFKPPTEDAVQQ